ncbi:MAG: phosphomannomutase/phosphoglucomutase [Candidatus Symbiobacter sp.]|nr:phosphomannomutase/phosphoglucomutase [Candidatus Symbiobacter sp.]
MNENIDNHKFDPTILREYDIRGTVGKNLRSSDAYAVGRAFGTILRRGGGRKIAVGYDGRVSSPELERALVAGLTAVGVEVKRIGIGPTPMLYYAVFDLELDGGIQVTGSHNPPDQNGFKMMLGRSPFYGENIQRLARISASGDWPANQEKNIAPEIINVLSNYIARLVKDFRGSKPLKLVWDAGNGAAGEAMQRLTERLPGEHILLFADIDGTFPNHHPDPTVEENLVDLKQAVAAHQADFGIGFDGDGDRIGIIDGKGRVLWGDQILSLLARQVLLDQPGAPIIADCKASQGLFDEITRLGGQPVMWKTGHSLIKVKLKELNAPLAGEMSGHIFIADRYYGFDDALYVAVRMIELVAQSGLSLADLRDQLPVWHNTPEIRIECDEARKFAVIDEVKARLAASGLGETVIDIDGVRVLNAEGWWLLRASNTQAVLVARAEAKSPDGLKRLVVRLAAELSQSGISFSYTP